MEEELLIQPMSPLEGPEFARADVELQRESVYTEKHSPLVEEEAEDWVDVEMNQLYRCTFN